MIPFLHLGPLTIPTFGLMVATGLLVAAYVLQADFDRRREGFLRRGYLQETKEPSHNDEGFLIIGIAGISGLVGAKLYHAFQDPSTWKAELVSRYGFAWFGGFLGGFVALWFLAKHYGIPVPEFMDMCSPAGAVGYAIGRIGCLLSGDGDYGVPTNLPWGMSFPNPATVPTTGPWDPMSHSGVCNRFELPENCTVHPTPIYEFLIWMLIAAILWKMGKKALNGEAAGKVFCGYLILTGVARFLIEFIRINPRSFFGMSNAQTASVVSIVLGIVWLLRTKSAAPASAKEAR
jgi:phosphatidylglycerol---prolipoprotein diacylglyceryl transferase